jgi:hypothetical protein
MKSKLFLFAALFFGLFAPSFAQTPPAPVSATAAVGKKITFVVTVSGTAPFTYVWKKNGVTFPNPGADQSQYVINSAVASDSGVYTVTISNSAGSTSTPNGTLTVANAPVILDFTLTVQ